MVLLRKAVDGSHIRTVYAAAGVHSGTGREQCIVRAGTRRERDGRVSVATAGGRAIDRDPYRHRGRLRGRGGGRLFHDHRGSLGRRLRCRRGVRDGLWCRSRDGSGLLHDRRRDNGVAGSDILACRRIRRGLRLCRLRRRILLFRLGSHRLSRGLPLWLSTGLGVCHIGLVAVGPGLLRRNGLEGSGSAGRLDCPNA